MLGSWAEPGQHTVKEETSNFAVLGLRFLDAVTDSQVRDGLDVRTWRRHTTGPVVNAMRTRSDIYAFHRLPGLRAFEMPVAPPEPVPSLNFIVEIKDRERRFVPVAVEIRLPLTGSGLFPDPDAGSPGSDVRGFYLFPALVRGRASNVAVVRGEMTEADTGAVVAHAVVRVDLPGQPPAFSISDERGGFAVQFPFPAFVDGFAPLDASPQGPVGTALADQSWPVTLSVYSNASALSVLPGSRYPDIRAIFNQPQADILIDLDSPPLLDTVWRGTLDFNGELRVATSGLSSLANVSPTLPP